MLPEWLKSIFRGTRKEVKETVNENVDAVTQKAVDLTKAAITKEAEIIKKAIPMANSVVDTVEHAADGILAYFKGLGYECPEHYNPAEFLSDLVAIDHSTEESEMQCKKRIEKLINAWEEEQEKKKGNALKVK